ncbi:unnamed protein product [Mytilus coruscus]|uniref:Chitin-binding type-2 domain-containing protein n=1 Tax=Mytilus coruscus TaxID=42192 RepID=A0A6J8C893_MYTCO|nr:unnamed protein product [Mytilus coruscus]
MKISSYVINNLDVGKTDLGNTVGYEECIDYVEKDEYDQIPADKDTINHDYLVLTSTVKEEIKQSNNGIHHQNKQPDIEVHQTKQSVLRSIFPIMLCIVITASVTAVATFLLRNTYFQETMKSEPCENGGTCVNDDCICDDGFAGVKCEIGFADGIHRDENIPEAGLYFECQNERIIYGGQNPCPTNMVPYNGKCTDLFEIKPSNWQPGYAIDCSGQPNGNYESEHVQKCDIYYTCVNGISTLTYCDSEHVFDSKSSFCQNTTNVCTPCGSVVHGC